MALDPRSTVSLHVAGHRLLKFGRPKEALQWFDRTLEFNPGSGISLLGRLTCLEQLGREEEAAEIRKTLAD